MKIIKIILAALFSTSACHASSPMDDFVMPSARYKPTIGLSNFYLAQLEHERTVIDFKPVKIKPAEPRVPQNTLRYWQDTFYACHHAGRQNFLFLLHDVSLLEEFTFTLRRLSNPELPSLTKTSLMVAAPSKDHEALSLHFKTHVFLAHRSNGSAFQQRDLHFCSNRFFEEPKTQSLTSIATNNEKYTCIFTHAKFLTKVLPLLHIQNGVIYISYEDDKDEIILLLKANDFRKRNIIIYEKMICAMRSDIRDFIRNCRPAHNPETPHTVPFKTDVVKNQYLKSLPSTPNQLCSVAHESHTKNH